MSYIDQASSSFLNSQLEQQQWKTAGEFADFIFHLASFKILNCWVTLLTLDSLIGLQAERIDYGFLDRILDCPLVL